MHRDPAYLYCFDTGCQVFIHILSNLQVKETVDHEKFKTNVKPKVDQHLER